MIDVSGLYGPDHPSIVERLVEAHTTLGFSQIVGHGVPPAVTDALFEVSRGFHFLPIERKRSVALDRLHRGFIEIDTSTDRHSSVETATRPNQSESFMVMREAGPNDPDVLAGALLAGPNQWPDLPGFREAVEQYQHEIEPVARAIVAALAEGIGDNGAIIADFERPTTWLRLLHYPPVAPDAPVNLYGSAPHVDYGGVTLLAQDTVGGLEIRGPGGWLGVEPVPGALVVNCGQMLERMSNGRLLPTAHRVHNRGGLERWSAAYFFDPHVNTTVTPAAFAIDDAHPPRFEPVLFADVIRAELGASFESHADLVRK